MELKDAILSTLAEMEEEIPQHQLDANTHEQSFKIQERKVVEMQAQPNVVEPFTQKIEETNSPSLESEALYLSSIRERLLVLFEGFQAPNNSNIEAKVDMTLNFLEYTLATIDARLEKLDKGISK
jgi:hypothetical protein